MKKIIVIFVLMVVCIGAFADVIYYPENVEEILGVEYSTGGGDKFIIYVEVFCKLTNGDMILFIASKGSLSGAFGFGRWTMPESIKFVKKTGLFNRVIWE